VRAAEFLLTTMRPEGRLQHVCRSGRTRHDAYLDDYAFLLQGLLDLYEATFEVRWIEQAEGLAQEMTERLWDGEAGGFYFAAPDQADLIATSKTAHDSAVPSGNAGAAEALLRLARLTGNEERAGQAEKILRLFVPGAGRAPQAHARLLGALDLFLAPPLEIAVCGRPGDEATESLLRAVRQRFLANKVVALLDPQSDEAERIVRAIPLLESKTMVDGKPTAYVCENYRCEAPATSVPELEERLTKQ
jgi:hypothetical protein